MSAYRIHRRMTPARRAWLERLREGPAQRRGRGPVGFACMHLGWTQWLFRRGDELRPRETIEAEFENWAVAREAGWEAIELETLTPEGRRVLEEAEAASP